MMTPVDFLIIAAYFVGMLLIGLYYERRTKSSEEYLLGGRNMRPWAVGLSLFATLVSTLSYLAVPGELIQFGPGIFMNIAAMPFIFLITGFLVIPQIMRQPVASAYELLEKRFGIPGRMLGAICFLTSRVFWMSAITYATAHKVIVPVFGLDIVWLPWTCALLGAVTVIYTSMGGIRAVVATDVLQSLVMFAGALLTLGVVAYSVSPLEWFPSTIPENWTSLNPLPKPDTNRSLFTFFLTTLSWYVCIGMSDQMAIQRYLSTRNAKAARRALGVSISSDACSLLILGTVGLAIFAYFRRFPEQGPPSLDITLADTFFPYFMVHILPPGITGLVIAALFSAAMSSMSSGLNSTCSVITVDVIPRITSTQFTEAQMLRINKVVSFGLGVVVVLLSMVLVQYQAANLYELCQKLVNLLTAPLAGLFFLALFIPRATVYGAYASFVSGLITVSVINYSKPLSAGLAQLLSYLGLNESWNFLAPVVGTSFFWAMPAGILVETVVGTVVSLLTWRPSPPNQDADPQSRQPTTTA